MKSFYTPGSSARSTASARIQGDTDPVPALARVAIYDGIGAAPRVEEVGSHTVGGYIEALASRVYELARERGGNIPYTVIREVSENLIHADFAEPIVSILDDGATVRFADQGPGIHDKDHAILPGFTTACAHMKQHIRGVGSGLPIVKDYLSLSGGELLIEDNLGCGSVVTVRSRRGYPLDDTTPDKRLRSPGTTGDTIELGSPGAPTHVASDHLGLDDEPIMVAMPRLSTRQKQVLALVMESGSAGPSLVANELGVAISTAYRDLASLEDVGLIAADAGKRQLTQDGLEYLKNMTSSY